MSIEFKFNINDRVTGSDGHEGTIEAQRSDNSGISYRLKLRKSADLTDTRKHYVESELLAGWETYQHERK